MAFQVGQEVAIVYWPAYFPQAEYGKVAVVEENRVGIRRDGGMLWCTPEGMVPGWGGPGPNGKPNVFPREDVPPDGIAPNLDKIAKTLKDLL